MLTKFQAIVISIVKHSDRYNVVTLYTRQQGRLAVLVPAGNSKNARMRNARLQLLSEIEGELNLRNNRDMAVLSGFGTAHLWRDIYFNPVKCGILFFLAEFLNKFLKATVAEEPLYFYIISRLQQLDNLRKGLGNFPISFLTGLLTVAGIMPDPTDWREGDWFDMRTAEWKPVHPLHNNHLRPDEASLAARLLRLGSAGTMRLRTTRDTRSAILSRLLEYFAIHYPGTAPLTTPALLREIY